MLYCKGINASFNDDVYGTLVCKAWGTVHEINVLHGTSEWRNYGGDSESEIDKWRVEGPVNLNIENDGITTAITGITDTKLTMSNNRIFVKSRCFIQIIREVYPF